MIQGVPTWFIALILIALGGVLLAWIACLTALILAFRTRSAKARSFAILAIVCALPAALSTLLNLDAPLMKLFCWAPIGGGILAIIRRQNTKPLSKLPWRFCIQCGYDLRASKDRCPECGEPIPAPPSSPPA